MGFIQAESKQDKSNTKGVLFFLEIRKEKADKTPSSHLNVVLCLEQLPTIVIALSKPSNRHEKTISCSDLTQEGFRQLGFVSLVWIGWQKHSSSSVFLRSHLAWTLQRACVWWVAGKPSLDFFSFLCVEEVPFVFRWDICLGAVVCRIWKAQTWLSTVSFFLSFNFFWSKGEASLACWGCTRVG